MPLAGSSTTGRNYLAWQLFRRPNHDWSFYLIQCSPIDWSSRNSSFAWLVSFYYGNNRSWKEKILLCWILVPLTFFQIWPVKGFQYLLPIAPPIAILAGRLLGKLVTDHDQLNLLQSLQTIFLLQIASLDFTW